MLKALLLENVHPLTIEILSAQGIEVETRTGALDENELIDALAGVHILGIRSKTQVTDRVIAASTDLLTIGAFCIGTNQIDLKSAAEHGSLCSTRPSPTHARSWRSPSPRSSR